MKHLLTGCPVCGAKLYLDSLNQYAIRQNIKKNGEISKTSRKIDYGTIEASLFYCSDSGCDFSTDTEWRGIRKYNSIKICMEDEKYYWEDLNEE